MSTVQSGSGIKSQPPVDLQKPPHELELDRKKALLAKVKMLREGALFNRGAILKGNSAKEYMWVNVKEERQIYFQGLGWELCKDPEVKTHFGRPDGTHQRADLILYEIDKEMFEAMQAYNVLRGLEATEGAEEAFLSTLQRDKVPVYRPKF